jgi:hypothetical protein
MSNGGRAPDGVGGDADDAGDVGKYDGDDLSGIVGDAIYAMEGFEGGTRGSTSLDGERYHCPYDGDGLVFFPQCRWLFF